jgi:hypothetical protein
MPNADDILGPVRRGLLWIIALTLVVGEWVSSGSPNLGFPSSSIHSLIAVPLIVPSVPGSVTVGLSS